MFKLLQRNKVRTRFAPSPTGYLHIGGLRTALYAYLWAKKNKGKFYLRIEDTDRSREIPEAVANLIESLTWAGLKPDEGIIQSSKDKIKERGLYGPYIQSKRLKIYQKYADQLVATGHAYHCFCSSERLEELRKDQEAKKIPTRYDGHCRNLSTDEIEKKLKSGSKSVIRLRVPENQEIIFNDLVRGEIKFATKDIDDQILIKADGFPTYHLAHVVDDHLMKTSLVIRGDEWLPSTPKHLLLFGFFGWNAPQYAHLPLILNPDKTKLSKRQGDVAVEDYRQKGYLPEALINYVALLGWNPGTEQEIFSLAELIKEFSFEKIHKAGAVFDIKKLDWMNGEYIKKMPNKKFVQLAQPYLKKIADRDLDSQELEKISMIEKNRVNSISEVGQGIEFLFKEIDYPTELLIWKKSDSNTTKERLKWLSDILMNCQKWDTASLEELLIKEIKGANFSNGEVLWPLRVALTGQEKSPTPFEVADILGQTTSINRIKKAIDRLS